MFKLTAANLVTAIGQLPRNRAYNYVSEKTSTVVEIHEIKRPEGPIYIKRYDPRKQEGRDSASPESISTQMLWRVTAGLRENLPVQFDRLLSGSYNTRSALEALLAHTPQFYFCRPGRIQLSGNSSKIKIGHKHLMWCPNNPHELGKIEKIKTELVISEFSVTQDVVYEGLSLPDELIVPDIDIDVQRRHAQIQIALILIGKQLGYKGWIARNDRAITYQNKPLGELAGVIGTLDDMQQINAYKEAISTASLIDCIWFKNHRLMPAVMEIEHSTGVYSGLDRMKRFQDAIPPIQTKYAIVAPDEDRDKVVNRIKKDQYSSLNARYFPYSAVEELYALCVNRKIKGVTEEFLDCYMESIN